VIDQSLSNFDPVWSTPFNPMTIFVVSAQIDSLDMELGDEIGIFDIDPNTGDEICVGAGLVTGTVSGQNILEIVVSMNDGSNPDLANGFTPGNPIIYKLWTSEMGEITDVSVNYPNPGFDEVFTPLGTTIVELNGNAMVMQQMAFLPGWNLISSRAEPLNSNMMTLFQPLIDNGLLEKVIDQNGNSLVYLPYPEPDGKWINSIGEMNMSEGYYVKVNDFVDVSMHGLQLELPFDIPLTQGWNIMGYPSPDAQDGLEVVEPLINNENLYKVLDDAGGLIQFIPYLEPSGQWINTIGDFTDGKGYYLKVNEGTTLTITDGSNKSAAFKSNNSSKELTYFEPVYQNNPYMPMHIILMTNGLLSEGDEVGIFDGDICVGASVYDGGSLDMSITVASMDDPDTEPVDGFTAGNGFTVKVYSNGNLHEQVNTEYMEGSPTFAPLESYVGILLGFITGVESNYEAKNEIRVSPNPASESTRIYMTLSSESKVEISLMNLSGRIAKNIHSAGFSLGNHHVAVDVFDLQPGVYVLKVLIEGVEREILYQKVVVQ
jgi:hypothetical protein